MKKLKEMLDGHDRNDSIVESHIHELNQSIDFLLDQQTQLCKDSDQDNALQRQIIDCLNRLFFVSKDLQQILIEAKSY